MGVQTEHDAAEDGDGGEDHGLELDDVGVHELGEDGEELHVLEEDGEGHHERDEQDDVVHHELVGDGEELHGEDEQGHGRVQDDGEDHERHDEAYEWEMRGEGLHEPGQDDAELREGARDLEEDEGEDCELVQDVRQHVLDRDGEAGDDVGQGAVTWHEVVVHGAGWDGLGHDAGLWHEAPCSADPDGGDLHGEGEV